MAIKVPSIEEIIEIDNKDKSLTNEQLDEKMDATYFRGKHLIDALEAKFINSIFTNDSIHVAFVRALTVFLSLLEDGNMDLEDEKLKNIIEA